MATEVAASSNQPASFFSRISNFVPAFAWLRTYHPAWLGVDVVAGLTLAAYLLVGGIDRSRTVAQVIEAFENPVAALAAGT